MPMQSPVSGVKILVLCLGLDAHDFSIAKPHKTGLKSPRHHLPKCRKALKALPERLLKGMWQPQHLPDVVHGPGLIAQEHGSLVTRMIQHIHHRHQHGHNDSLWARHCKGPGQDHLQRPHS